MEFDRKKIKTIATCDEVKSGDVGWFSDSVRELQAKVVLNGEMDTIDKINISTPNGPFQPIWGEFSCQYFYPYEEPKAELPKNPTAIDVSSDDIEKRCFSVGIRVIELTTNTGRDVVPTLFIKAYFLPQDTEGKV